MGKEKVAKSISELKPQDFKEAGPKDLGINIYTNGYYIRNEKKEPKVTVTFAVDMTDANNPIISMGFAIAGPEENPWKTIGAWLSEARAVDALKLKEKANTTEFKQIKKRLRPVKREEAIQILKECHAERFIGMNKGVWNISLNSLTEYEQKLVQDMLGD